MSRRLICLIASVMVISAAFCSANRLPADLEKVKPISVLGDVSKVPIRYKPEEIRELLGSYICLSSKGRRYPEVIDVLAATDDKLRPNTILGKYSINDLLSMNEVYESDFTPETFQDKLALCESLKPSDEMRIKACLVPSRWNCRPNDYVFQRNLYDYCMEAFDNYHYTISSHMRVNDELDTKVKRLEAEVDRFIDGYPSRYLYAGPRYYHRASMVMKDFLKEKQPDEVAQIKAICQDLIDKVGFVADRELYRYQWAPTRYRYVFTYCKGVAKLSM